MTGYSNIGSRVYGERGPSTCSGGPSLPVLSQRTTASDLAFGDGATGPPVPPHAKGTYHNVGASRCLTREHGATAGIRRVAKWLDEVTFPA